MNPFFKIHTKSNYIFSLNKKKKKKKKKKKTNSKKLVSNNEMALLNHFQLFNQLIEHS